MHKLLCAALAAVMTLTPSLASAAIIGPTNDWKPLRSGAQQLGVSPEMVNRILAAGVELTCPGTVHRNGGMLNGWFLGTDATSFYTNAHGIIDIGYADHKANFIEPLDKCAVYSYRDMASRGRSANPYFLAVPQDRTRMALATFAPQSAPAYEDRARLRLMHGIPGSRPLPLPDFSQVRLQVGQEVIMVSMTPPSMRSPEIQSCHIRAIGRSGPAQLFTDCDNGFGNSAGLYFVRNPSNPGMLLPVALHEGCHELVGDHRGWDIQNNTAVGIILQRNFFALRGT